jgi:hypothetical protein
VPFNGLQQCCGSGGAPVAKSPIANLADCPDRVSKPGFVVDENGCGTKEHPLPHNYGKAEFTPVCNVHDDCYGSCPNDKQACDNQLLSSMDAICVNRFNRLSDLPDKIACRQFVRGIGGKALSTKIAQDAYDRAQKDGCQCCR